jgi:hypothetical protein
VSTPTLLSAAALAQVAPARPAAARSVGPALARGGLFLTSVALVPAAAEPLAALPWPVPAGALAAGWCGLSVLGPWGRTVAARSGPARATRLVLAGFLALAAAGAAVLTLAPARLVGDDRAPAYAVGLSTLALLAAVTAAVATGTEPALLRWAAPALLAAAAVVAGWLPAPGPALPPGTALLAGIGVVAARGFAPALRRGRAGRGAAGRGLPRQWAAGAPYRYRADGLRRWAAHLGLGLGQVAMVAMAWRVGQAVAAPAGPPPVLLPLVLALPVIEVWVGWHLVRVAAGLAGDDRERHQRQVRELGWTTLTALLPPLVAGAALAGTAVRLPFGLSRHPDATGLVLSMAAGVLLAGVVAVGRLLSGRDRPGLAAAVTAAPVVATPALAAAVPGLAAASLTGWGQLLPAAVVALGVAYAAGLVLAAYVLFDTRAGIAPLGPDPRAARSPR